MHVGEVSFEESFHSFILGDLLPAVQGSLVHLLLLPTHHHQPSPHGVEGVSHRHRARSHGLSREPRWSPSTTPSSLSNTWCTCSSTTRPTGSTRARSRLRAASWSSMARPSLSLLRRTQ